jgi:hypothetical protein
MRDNDEKFAIISPEGGIFGTLSGRYSASGNANIDVILQSYMGESVRVIRIGRESVTLNNPILTMLVFAQPKIVEEIMSNEIFKGRGLLARILYSFPASRVGSRVLNSSPIPDVNKDRYYSLVKSLLKLESSHKPPIIKLSCKAYVAFEEFYNRIETMLYEELAYMADWGGRIRGNVLRIAGLLHITNKTEAGESICADVPESLEVCESLMQDAIIIGEYFIEHAKKAYGLMGENPGVKDAEYILKKISEHKIERATKKEFVRICRRFKSTNELTEPLGLLVKYNYLREVRQEYNGTGRRPDNIYLVNPKIL